MERVATSLALTHSSGSSGPQPNGPTISAELASKAERVWSSMAELFGPAFAAAYGDVPSPIWLATIDKLSEAELGRGFTALAQEPRDYPPNLTQFAAACRPPSSPRFLGVPMTPAEIRNLDAPKNQRARIEDIDDWLASMRQNVANAKIVTRREGMAMEGTLVSRACTCQCRGTCKTCRGYMDVMEGKHLR